MARIQPLQPGQMNAEQQRIHDLIASGPRGRVRGPLAVWLHRPALAEPAQALGRYCRYETSLPPRLSEWAILVLARHWRSEFEWWAHKQLALKAGLDEAMIDALRDDKPIPYVNDDEALVHEFLTTLHAQRHIPDALYEKATMVLGEAGIIDLVGIAGYYSLVSMTLNVFEVMPPEGEPIEMGPHPGQASK
ncbi:carboxymuconolactone decarboxylase family protein [Bordetella bronchialis]|uniref:4-carboxymuconolactone decarboxylase n=1 Tax=Bordetella bronchialis TaxID=463025 RepID=A0A193FTL8_9BORD|nr:4-carboxymuconolactone decarboxylase [Bordetella bronchialis]ANN71102.1 4-carboxymuconolactone decarboxylase [Bordetella bronchialis]